MFAPILGAALIEQCAHVAIPEASELAMRYYRSGNILWILQQAWGLILPLLFLFTGFSAALEKSARKCGKNWFFTIVFYLLFFILLYTLLQFPLDFYAGYLRDHQYGLSSQSLSRWFGSYGKELLIMLLSAIAFVWIFYLLLKKSPRRWWLYGTLVSIGIMIVTNLIQPIWLDPLFNTFGPMKDKQLEERILILASRSGIEQGKVFEVDKSLDTKMLNAYVVGFGKTRRIVLWDTTLKAMSGDQVLFVMAHEMGHYVLHHVWWGMLYSAALIFLVFFLIYKTSLFLLHRYHGRFGFSHLHAIASFPLFLFLINLYLLLFSPLSNFVSRYFEHEADRFALEITQNNQVGGETFLVLQQGNLANPRPGMLFKVFRSTHPPLGDRIEFCNSYCPWTKGEPLKYEKYFQNE